MMDRQTDICDCRVAFATEKLIEQFLNLGILMDDMHNG